MKRVYLIGDSIRFGLWSEESRKLGYGYHVKKLLEGEMEVLAPDDNCRFAMYTLRYLHEWAAQVEHPESIDAVHWNNGLWDCLRLFGDDPLCPLEMYPALLVKIFYRIRMLFPNAKVIFALSTPVTESESNPDFTRRNEEIRAYNQAAEKALKPLGVVINDLYTAAENLRPEHAYDWVHYSEMGSALLAEQVVACIQQVLVE